MSDVSETSECQHLRLDTYTGQCPDCCLILEKGSYIGNSDYDDMQFTQMSSTKKTTLYPATFNIPYGPDIIKRAEDISNTFYMKGNRKGRLAHRRYRCLTLALRENNIPYDPETVAAIFGLKKGDKSQSGMFTSIDSGYRPSTDVAKHSLVHPGIRMLKAKAVLLKIPDEAADEMIRMIKIGLSYKPNPEDPPFGLNRRKPVTIAAGAINAYQIMNPSEIINPELFKKHITVSQPTIKEATNEIIRAYNAYVPF